jgi:anti-sigma factor RsiW
MTEHLSAQLIERYRRRTLSPAELIAADDHLVGCEACQHQLYETPRVHSALELLQSELLEAGLLPDHLTEEQLAAYVDGALDETAREIADSHLQLCSPCTERLNELRTFAAQLAAFPAREYAPATPPSRSEAFSPVAKARHWRERLLAFWPAPAFQLSFQLASLGLILALLLWVAALKTQNSQLQTTLTAERQETEKLRQDYQATSATVAELQQQLAQPRPTVQPSSSALVTLNDGGQVTLDREGRVTGVAQPYQQAVKQTLTTGRIETPQLLAELIGKSGTLMGPADEGHPFALLSPVGTVVLSDRPAFRWRALAGADSYVVRIYDADFNEVAASPQLSVTTWAVSRPLERGRTYSWQVTTRVGEREVTSPVRPAPEAKFMVLDQARANELTKAKNASAGSHLTLGILYAQAGLLDDAEREFQALQRANPQSALAERLLHSVRAKRRP